MTITDEILAAYADGTLPEELLPAVRRYLSEHPEELSEVIHLMDVALTLPEDSEINYDSPTYEGSSTSLLGNSAAAFVAPKKNMPSVIKHKSVDIQQNLDNLLSELN